MLLMDSREVLSQKMQLRIPVSFKGTNKRNHCIILCPKGMYHCPMASIPPAAVQLYIISPYTAISG